MESRSTLVSSLKKKTNSWDAFTLEQAQNVVHQFLRIDSAELLEICTVIQHYR